MFAMGLVPFVCGDFNMTYRDDDKNNDNLRRCMMGRVRHVLNDYELKEVYHHGRHYTWPNKCADSTLVILDRCFS